MLCAFCHFVQAVNFLVVDNNRAVAITMLVVSYIALLIGFGAIQGNILSFACNQVFRATGEELSSLFHWYFWTRNIGALFSVITQVLFKLNELQRGSLISVLPAAMSCLALVIIFCCKHHFYTVIVTVCEIRNPLQLSIQSDTFSIQGNV